MEWRAGGDQGADEDLKDEVLQKIEEGTLSMEDIREYFTVFTQIANNTEDIREEMKDFNRSFQINVEGEPLCWLSVETGRFEAGSGSHPNPDIVLGMEEEVALGIFGGSLDPASARMCGDLEVDGMISAAIRFNDLLEMVQEEMH